VVELHADGRIRPAISERIPLEGAPHAIARLAARQGLGKIVVVF